MIRLFAYLLPPTLSRKQIVSYSQTSCVPLVDPPDSRWGAGGGGGGLTWSQIIRYRKKAWLSINLLSVSFPPPLSRQQGVSLSQSSCVSLVDPPDSRCGWGWSQIIPYREKAWPSINHSILSWRTPLHLLNVDFFQVSVLLAVLMCALFSVEAAPAPAPAPTIGLAGLGLLGLGGLVFLKGQWHRVQLSSRLRNKCA
jgi:hypothetical protein